MQRIILVVICVVAATPAWSAGTGFNPGTTMSDVYQNPAAGYGYGIGSGFGLPPRDQYRYVPGHGYQAYGYQAYGDATPRHRHRRPHDSNRYHPVVEQQ